MKKLLCLILVLILSLGVIAACGNDSAKNSGTEGDVSTSSGETAEEKESVITPDTTPSGNSSDFYLVLNGTNEESILYHTGACPLLKDKEVQKTSWEMIEMLEFRHCAKCNPPKYKGYVE